MAGLIYAQGVHHRIYIPHKNTGIPEEIIFLNIAPGCFQIGFLFKRIHPEYLLIGGRRYTEISFNVTVARLRRVGFMPRVRIASESAVKFIAELITR